MLQVINPIKNALQQGWKKLPKKRIGLEETPQEAHCLLCRHVHLLCHGNLCQQ